ncbi:MAG: sugar ABC transporter permease [Actinocatenispora sp.]
MKRRQARAALAFLAVPMLFFALMFFYPLVNEFATSMFSGPRADVFTGLGNYTRALGDDTIQHAFLVTVLYGIGALVVSASLGLLLALILNQRLPGRAVLRGVLLVPYLTSIAIVGLLWRNILDPQIGILNRLLGEVGLPTQAWLTTHPLATLVAIAVWQQVGYLTVLFLAGLQGIPEMYYEAAEVDGASVWRRFRHVTVPLLAPTTLFVSVIGVISALQEFALPYLVTGGGPADATDLFVFRMYQEAFNFRDFGYASALSYLLLIVILVLSVVQLKVGQRDDPA